MIAEAVCECAQGHLLIIGCAVRGVRCSTVSRWPHLLEVVVEVLEALWKAGGQECRLSSASVAGKSRTSASWGCPRTAAAPASNLMCVACQICPVLWSRPVPDAAVKQQLTS